MSMTSRERQAAKRARDRAVGIVEVLVRVPERDKDTLRTFAAALRGDLPPSMAAGVTASLGGTDLDQVARALSGRARSLLEATADVLDGATEAEIERLARQVALAADRRARRHLVG